MSAVTGGPDPHRVVQVLANRASGRVFGSGYQVSAELVLTVWHVVADVPTQIVRFIDAPGRLREVAARTIWTDVAADVAVLRLETPQEYVAPVRFGRLGGPAACEAVGYPRFKLRGPDASDGTNRGVYRDSHHVLGSASPYSNLRAGTLELTVTAPPDGLDPARSPWEGMSGAAVFVDGQLIGMVSGASRYEGQGTLTASPVTAWFRESEPESSELQSLLGLPSASELPVVGAASARSLVRQLPPDTPFFTGRASELDELLSSVGDAASRDVSGAVAISLISGMSGIGKTTLAVHAAHRLADRFPDGQVFVDLHGDTQGVDPRNPADAVAVVLRSLGVPPQRIPDDLDARAAIYRNRLAGTRTLIILDNAANEAQVRHLLPGTSECAVLVTSRRTLRGLDDVHRLPLDVLPLNDAVALFRTAAGLANSDTVGAVSEQIARLCGQLPLALRMCGALVRQRPTLSMQHLSWQLSNQKERLQFLSDGDRDIAALFDLSLRSLADGQQRLFRYLAIAQGPDIDAYAAAALIDADPAEAELLLGALVDNSLLNETAPGRYRMHDLIRNFNQGQVASEPEQQRDAAQHRLLDYYRHTAAQADTYIAWHTLPDVVAAAPMRSPDFPDWDAALFWLRTERANLIACIEFAANHENLGGYVTALCAGVASLLRIDGPWTQAIAVHTTSLATAERLGDQLGRANALIELGVVRLLTGAHESALRALQAALELYHELGEPRGRATALTEIGSVCRSTSDYENALRVLGEALELYQNLGDLRGQATALIELGVTRQLTGDYQGAVQGLEMALDLYQNIGDRRGQAAARARLGTVRHATGDYTNAVREHDIALQLHRSLGYRHGQADTLAQIGTVRRLTGDYAGAAHALEESLEIYRDLDDRRGRATALTQLGAVHRLTGDHPAAMHVLEESLEIYRDLGDRRGRATALTEMGAVRGLTGDLSGAARDLEESLELYRKTGSYGDEARALIQYADIFTAAGDPHRAAAIHRDALRLAREVQQPGEEALALARIGEHLLLEGDLVASTAHLRQSLELFQRLAMHADVQRVEARLAQTGTAIQPAAASRTITIEAQRLTAEPAPSTGVTEAVQIAVRWRPPAKPELDEGREPLTVRLVFLASGLHVSPATSRLHLTPDGRVSVAVFTFTPSRQGPLELRIILYDEMLGYPIKESSASLEVGARGEASLVP